MKKYYVVLWYDRASKSDKRKEFTFEFFADKFYKNLKTKHFKEIGDIEYYRINQHSTYKRGKVRWIKD